MKITNRLGLPEPFYYAATQNVRTPKPNQVSVTQLYRPPKEIVLTEEHWDDITMDVSDLLWSILGTVGHAVLERGNPMFQEFMDIMDSCLRLYPTDPARARQAWGACLDAAMAAHDDPQTYSEHSMSVEIDGTKLTGIMDYLSGARRISDYKYTTAYATKDGLKPEWIAQQNCYRWMLHETTGILARELTIVAIYRDWHWRRAQKDMTYPQNPVEVLELPVWELEETAEWIQHRIAGIQYARATGDLRDCTDEERWQEKGAYALMKKKRKSAIKLFNSEPELRDYAENHKSERLLNPAKDLYIQRRYPVSKKCEHYCPALNFCDQGQKTMMERDPENYPL